MRVPQSTRSRVITVVGGLMVIAAVAKASVIGYYNSDLSWLIPLIAVGGVLVFLGQKLD